MTTLERDTTLNDNELAVTDDVDTSTALINRGSVLTVWNVSDISTITLYANCGGTYRIAQREVDGVGQDMVWTLTGNQPLRVEVLGYKDIKLVGDFPGVIGYSFTG
jgi:hypothetical protein